MEQHPVLTMIQKMTTTDQSDRLNVNDLVKSIDNAKLHECPFINKEIFKKIKDHIDLSDESADKQLKNYFEHLDNLS